MRAEAATAVGLAAGSTSQYRSKTVDVSVMVCEASKSVLIHGTKLALSPIFERHVPCSRPLIPLLAASSTYSVYFETIF